MTPEQTKKFKYWQTRTIIVSMIGYALYYFVRKNFNTAMPSIEATFGITKTQLGIFLTLNGVIYGVSRFINGFIADRVSARKFMALGLALCALVNIGFGFSDKMALLITGTAGGSEYITALTIIMGSILLLNGYFQGMGVPPVSPLMTHWVPANELATKMSIWNMSHSIGAGLIFVLGALLVHHFDNSAWRLCFLVPAAISLIGAGALYLTLRDKPSSVGLPELETQAAPPAVGEKKETTSDSAYHKAFLRRMVFGNPIIWVLAVTNFFVYIVRFSMLDWGMMLLPGSKGVSVAVAGIMVAVFEFVGGNLGMVVAGWATDHIFGSRAHRTCVFCMLGAIISTAIFWLVPDTASAWVLAIPFTLIAFFIYGPQALLGIAAANQATKEAAASANGILGIFGYASTLISGVGFGYVADHYGWGSTYIVILAFAVVGMLTIATIWNAKGDGYEAAAKFNAEREKKSICKHNKYTMQPTKEGKISVFGHVLRSDESGARHQAIGTQRRGLPPRGCDGRPFRSQPHVRRRFHRGDAPRNEAAARHPPDGRTPPPDHGGDGHPSRRPDFAARRTGGTAARAGESRPGARSAFRTGGESSTPVEALTPYLDEIEWVILMLVQPGFAGAKLIDGILDKVAAARRFLDEHGHPETEISVDGSVSCERARLMRDMGASIFVGGTAGIYRKGMTLDESIPLFRQAIK